MITRLQVLYSAADLQDDASTLVTQHNRARHGQATACMRTQIRMTDPCRHHLHEHFIGTRRA
jgi:hypothetical protein